MSGFGYDETGNTTEIKNPDSSKTLFSYDDADRLTRIEQRNSANVPLAKSEFVYDYASRKAVSLEFTRTNGAWVKTGEKRRVFDGLDVVQERNAGNQVTAQLVRDGNIGGILSRSTAAGATFFGYDGGGNVTLLTDANGDDVGRYRYDAFGNTLEVSGARAAENPYRFSTKELHAASGLYDFGFRFYSPGLGRWINRDPIQEAGGINLYAMVGNDPVNSWDEYGEDAVDEITKALARSHRTITNVEAEIAKRISELREDRLKLPERAPGDVKNPSLSRWGHRMMLNKHKANLAALKAARSVLVEKLRNALANRAAAGATAPSVAARGNIGQRILKSAARGGNALMFILNLISVENLKMPMYDKNGKPIKNPSCNVEDNVVGVNW